MAETNVQINDQAFQQRDVTANFDEEAFSQLIAEYVPGAEAPEIVITPHMLWDKGSILQRLRNLRSGDTMLPVGGYSQSTNSITVPASEDQDRTNTLLLHETKHFIDAATGASEKSGRDMKRRFIGGLAVAATGMAIGFITGKKGVAIASAAAGIATLPASYWKAPHEVAARDFAKSKEVTDRYGKIITYENRK